MKNMSRYFIDCTYLGSKYVGWQRQLNGISVQEEIERALLVVFQEEVKIHGSSRTDAGVHALHQFAHVDLPGKFSSLEDLTYKLNNLLPKDISINELTQVPKEVHARFEAIGRKYVYRIHTFKSPFNAETSYYFRQSLNVELMNAACEILLKSTDFESFSKVKTAVNNFICKIELAEWTTNGNNYSFTIQANRFLRGMVRAIVGTMIEVGSGKMTLEQFEEIINQKDRSKAGRNVPAHGLTLERVIYPTNLTKNKQRVNCVVEEISTADIPVIRLLFTEYQKGLGVDLCFQRFQEEVANLPGAYSEPNGIILKATITDEIVGCVALKKLDDGSCEMKRLYVIPAAKGKGIGKQLVLEVEKRAVEKGYKIIKLDTLARLEIAVNLYQKMGFVETSPYNYSPEGDILYFEKSLQPINNG
jgi:tRNA pseudouridine38-40 synthase